MLITLFTPLDGNIYSSIECFTPYLSKIFISERSKVKGSDLSLYSENRSKFQIICYPLEAVIPQFPGKYYTKLLLVIDPWIRTDIYPLK
jgi:hypothetical protein